MAKFKVGDVVCVAKVVEEPGDSEHDLEMLQWYLDNKIKADVTDTYTTDEGVERVSIDFHSVHEDDTISWFLKEDHLRLYTKDTYGLIRKGDIWQSLRKVTGSLSLNTMLKRT